MSNWHGWHGRTQGRGRYFDDLRPRERDAAWRKLRRLVEERGGFERVSWRMLGALVANVRSLLLCPRGSDFGRMMVSKLGGYKVQELYRQRQAENPLWQHPAIYAAKVSASRRRWRKQQREEGERRAKLGLAPKARVGWTGVDGV